MTSIHESNLKFKSIYVMKSFGSSKNIVNLHYNTELSN